MKKIVATALAALTFAQSLVFAAGNEKALTGSKKLTGSWAGAIVSEEFFKTYFPYLARNDYEKFSPAQPINDFEFTLSLSTLFKKYGYYTPLKYDKTPMNRLSMSIILKKALSEVSKLSPVKLNSIGKFKDTAGLSNDELTAITELFERKLIAGTGENTFGPYESLTQIQSAVILTRVDKLLKEASGLKNSGSGPIKYRIESQEKRFSGRDKGISANYDQNGNLIIKLTWMLPNPNYSVQITDVYLEDGVIKIKHKLNAPQPGEISLQVITFLTQEISISKQILDSLGIEKTPEISAEGLERNDI